MLELMTASRSRHREENTDFFGDAFDGVAILARATGLTAVEYGQRADHFNGTLGMLGPLDVTRGTYDLSLVTGELCCGLEASLISVSRQLSLLGQLVQRLASQAGYTLSPTRSALSPRPSGDVIRVKAKDIERVGRHHVASFQSGRDGAGIKVGSHHSLAMLYIAPSCSRRHCSTPLHAASM